MWKIVYPTKAEFEKSMAQGFPWDRRLEIVGELVDQVLDEWPNRLHRNGDIVSRILNGYGIPGDRASPLFKPTAAAITALGRKPEYADQIRLGKEIKCGGQKNKDGSPKYVRERLWCKRGPETAEPLEEAHEEIQVTGAPVAAGPVYVLDAEALKRIENLEAGLQRIEALLARLAD